MIETHLESLKNNGYKFCTSQAAMMETLYKPYRDNDQLLINIYSELFGVTKILPNYFNLLSDGLRFMKEETLKAMDAIHIAFAVEQNCELFVTTDPDFHHIKILPVHWIDLSKVTPN